MILDADGRGRPDGPAYELVSESYQQQQQHQQNGFSSKTKTSLASLREDRRYFVSTYTVDPSKVRLISRGSTYTRLWTHDDWHRHLSVSRYFRHILEWPTSTIAWRICPVCLLVVLWALTVKQITERSWISMELPFTCGLLFGQAITLLLTLRTNQSLSRVQEARGVFNGIVTAGRELASLASAYVHNEEMAVIFTRYIAIFGWSVKYVVRGEKDESEYRSMLAYWLAREDARFVQSSPSSPLALIRRARQVLASGISQGIIDKGAHRTIEIKLGALNDLFGKAQKIFRSPSPPAYTRHTSRVLLVFLFIVPMGLADLELPVHFLVIASAFITYLLVGIEEIGVELEEPFRWLPLHELCTQLLEETVDEFADAPPLPIISA